MSISVPDSGGEDKDFGENLLIHEFGHTFTGPTPTEPVFNEETGKHEDKLVPKFNYFPSIFNFQIADKNDEVWPYLPFSVALADNANTPSEITADAFMHWILEPPGSDTTLSQIWGTAINAAAGLNQESRMP